ncbi:MAG: phosphate acetyltransferase [Nanoarchaeota archaeon]|nr:phosphate acetyltransferase [Nanoarchaeota archaeon]
MDIIKKIIKDAKKNPKKIVLVEGEDERVKKAAKIIEKKKIAKVVLLEEGDLYSRLEKAKELLQKSEVDGIISGATHATSKTIRLAFNFKKGLVSGAFLMILKNKVLWFADAGVVPVPDEKELAKISVDSAKEFNKLTGIEPKVALLSFSTKGSAEHACLNKIRNAVNIAKQLDKNLIIDGELQVDAALVPEIAKKKNSEIIKGDANVLIFPDLNSGNISYKLIERLCGAKAIGPILQNLEKPVNDLSRGCSVQDIVELCAITVIQAQ